MDNLTNITQNHDNGKKLTQFLMIVAFLSIVSIIFLWHVMFPFVVGIFLAFVIDPLVSMLERNKVKRVYSSIGITLLLLIILLYFFIGVAPNLVTQISELVSKISNNFQNKSWFSKTVTDFLNHYHISINEQEILDNLKSQLSHIVSSIFSSFVSLLTSGLKVIIDTVIIIFTLFCILKEKAKIRASFQSMLPPQSKSYISNLADKLFGEMNQFIRGTIVTSFIIFLFMFILLNSLKVPFATPLSIFSGFISLIPYIGPVMQILTIFIVQIANFTSFSPIIWVLFIQIIFYQIVGLYLYPSIIGNSIQVHPLIIFTCTIIGGSIAGIFGMLLSIPIFIVIRGIFLALLTKYKENASPTV